LLASEYNSEIIETLNRTAEILRDEQNWLDSIIDPLFEKIKLPADNANVTISIPELRKIPIAAAKRIIRKAVFEVKGNLHGVGFRHMDAILELITSDNKKNQFDLPGRVGIKREKDMLVIIRRKNKGRVKCISEHNEMQRSLFEYQIGGPQTVVIKEIGQLIQLTELSSIQVLCLKETKFYAVDPQEAYMDMASICYPLIVRTFRPGDRFSPLGLSGFQKLKKFFINNKIPFAQRKSIPILECSGKIIWVAGYRIDDSVKVKPYTQKVLKARLLKSSI
jgi:tRNA(Ile)-lysidine synthase